MTQKCYFTGRKARRVCPGAVPGRPVPISAEACTQRMIYDITCPPDCRHVIGNYQWQMEKIRQRLPDRVSREPWLAGLTGEADVMELFFELERRLALMARTGEASQDEDVALALADLEQVSRSKNAGLVIAGSTFELSRSAVVFRHLEQTLNCYRASIHSNEPDRSDDARPPSFLHQLLDGAVRMTAQRQQARRQQLKEINPVALRELQQQVSAPPWAEQLIQQALRLLKRSLDHHRSRGGYLTFISRIY
ncbi:MAG: hypothetical protein Kow0059_11010 [Candidatus Sumerlaeia bacterium]